MNEPNKIPVHIAVIMDGNGRWARLRGKERYEGHLAGMDALRETVKNAADYGVKYLTVYAFSTENWGRPQQEVDALMDLMCKGVEMETPQLMEQGVRVLVIGDRSRFSDKVRAALDRIEEQTGRGERMTRFGAQLFVAQRTHGGGADIGAARGGGRNRGCRDHGADHCRDALHFGDARSRSGDPHQRRVSVEQLHAVAGILFGVVFH